jgi:hypothetical protein
MFSSIGFWHLQYRIAARRRMYPSLIKAQIVSIASSWSSSSPECTRKEEVRRKKEEVIRKKEEGRKV